MRLKRDDFIENGFTEGCPGCKSILSGGPVRNHTEACRKRMEGVMQKSNEGQARIKRQIDRENEHISRILEKHDTEEQVKKKAKPDTEASPQGGATEADQPMEIVPAVRSQSRASSSWERPDDTDPKRQKTEPSVEEEPMETNMVERMFQDDMQ